jgi:putative ABC transport system substrate-binding protein
LADIRQGLGELGSCPEADTRAYFAVSQSASPEYDRRPREKAMRRRDLITLIGSAAAWPLAARAQERDRVRRIGALQSLAEDDPGLQGRLEGFRQGLEQLGWAEGRNVHIDYRYAAGNPERFGPLARELIALRPDVILTSSGPITAAVKQESRSIPIVFTTTSDPIGAGLVDSLARPGGSITGFLLYEEGIVGKWLAMLKEIAPNLARVALVGNPKTMPYEYYLRMAVALASSLAIELVPMRVETAADIGRSIEQFGKAPNGGLMLPADSTTNSNLDSVVMLAARHRLPAVYSLRRFVTAGGLMSYDTDRVDIYRRAALYVDRILRGASPAELPVQAPTKFETVLNLKVAKELGLAVPSSLLVAADTVVQ